MGTDNFESPEYVQKFLDTLAPQEEFTVSFVKQDGTPRTLKGRLDPEGKARKVAVPIMTPDGWKSFLVSRVVHITKGGN